MAAQTLPLGAAQPGVPEIAMAPGPGTLRRAVGVIEGVVYYGLLATGVVLPIALLVVGWIRG